MGGGEFVCQLLELLMQVASNLHDVFKQAIFFDDGQVLEADPAGQRPPAKSCSMLSGRDGGGEMFFGEEGAERHAGGDWLGDGDDVGDDCEALEGEQFAGAAETALDLVENERGLMMVGQGAAGKEEFFGTFED